MFYTALGAIEGGVCAAESGIVSIPREIAQHDRSN